MKRILLNLIVIALIIINVPVNYVYAEEQKSIFYDDFENGHVFWDFGSLQSMRILDGKMISDIKESVSAVKLRGESTHMENFTMDTVFETDSNNSWFGILIRQGSVGALHFVIHKNGFYTTTAPLSGGGCEYSFKNGVQYLFRIVASEETIKVQIKENDKEEFEKEWTGTFENSGTGYIEFRSFQAKARIDSVRITQAVDEPIYYENKFLSAYEGETISAVPSFEAGFTADSITYSSSSESFTVDENGNVTVTADGDGYGVITATAIYDGAEYIAICDVARKVPIESLGSTGFAKISVGDTKNISVTYIPSNATNKALIWETDNPEAIELVGDTEGAIGIRGLAPARNVRVCAKSKENPNIKLECYISVEGRPSEIKAQEFNVGGDKREIPYGMLGMSDIPYVASVEEMKAYEELHYPYWEGMKLQQFRTAINAFDLETGNIVGRYGDFECTVEDIYKTANKLDVPINISLNQYFDSAEKIIKLATEIRKVTDKEICFGIWEECYDGRMSAYEPWPVESVYDYTDFLKEIYPKVKAAFPDGSVKIGATILDHPSYIGYGNGVGTAITNMVGTWNKYVAEAIDYYDAVAIHHYSGGASIDTKSIMEGFAVDSTCLKEGLEVQAEMFPGKEFWVNEWGDLPMELLFYEKFESNKARNQYMKSLGNAMGYLQRVLEMTLDENVTMSAYHGYNDAQGFGTVQASTEEVYKLPAYYMFSMVGDLFDKHSHIYSMDYSEDKDLHYMKDMSALRHVAQGEYVVEASLVNSWGFGDETEIEEAVFQNSSEYYVKVYIPGYDLKKKMSYGNGENPLPDLAVNPNDKMVDLPEYIPEPVFYEDENFEEYILMEPYSVVRAELTLADNIEWETVIEDDFAGDLSNWTADSGFVLQDNDTLRLYAHNQYLVPNIDAAKNIILEFDTIGWQSSGIQIVFENTDSTKSSFSIPISNGDISTGTIGIMHQSGSPSIWSGAALAGGTVDEPKRNSVRIILKNGSLSIYVKPEEDTDYALLVSYPHSYTHGNGVAVSSIIDFGSTYIPKIYQVYSGEDYNAEPTYIDNVKIKTPKKLKGTDKIVPQYKTVFEDDFSGALNASWITILTGKLSDKWNVTYRNNVNCSITENNQLLVKGHNAYLTPSVDIAYDNMEIEYDYCGLTAVMMLEFYNVEDQNDWFRVRCQDGHTYVFDSNDSIHNFGCGIKENEWQTVKFKLQDGLLDVFVKDSDATEFTNSGRPYSHIWYNAEDENVSFMKKNVKYGVKIYVVFAQEAGFMLDNFKIRAIPTEVSVPAYKNAVNVFDINDIEIMVKTDDGYERTSSPVAGALNKFRLKSVAKDGNSISGKAIFGVYDGNRLLSVATSDMEETIEASVYIPYDAVSPGVKLMVWEDMSKNTPMTQPIDY